MLCACVLGLVGRMSHVWLGILREGSTIMDYSHYINMYICTTSWEQTYTGYFERLTQTLDTNVSLVNTRALTRSLSLKTALTVANADSATWRAQTISQARKGIKLHMTNFVPTSQEPTPLQADEQPASVH